jgi:ribosomal protein S27AE
MIKLIAYASILMLPFWMWRIETSSTVKWVSLIFAGVFLMGAWFAATSEGGGLPSVHLVLPFGLWTAVACRHWLHPRKKHSPRLLCGRCGYELTRNVKGVCPRCGHSTGPVRKSAPMSSAQQAGLMVRRFLR